MTAALRLAAGDGIGAGMWGFLVVLGLIVGAVFLFRSMSRHLRRVPREFDQPPPPYEDDDTQSTDAPKR